MPPQPIDWRHLAAQIITEMDSKKLSVLSAGLIRALDEENAVREQQRSRGIRGDSSEVASLCLDGNPLLQSIPTNLSCAGPAVQELAGVILSKPGQFGRVWDIAMTAYYKYAKSGSHVENRSAA